MMALTQKNGESGISDKGKPEAGTGAEGAHVKRLGFDSLGKLAPNSHGLDISKDVRVLNNGEVLIPKTGKTPGFLEKVTPAGYHMASFRELYLRVKAGDADIIDLMKKEAVLTSGNRLKQSGQCKILPDGSFVRVTDEEFVTLGESEKAVLHAGRRKVMVHIGEHGIIYVSAAGKNVSSDWTGGLGVTSYALTGGVGVSTAAARCKTVWIKDMYSSERLSVIPISIILDFLYEKVNGIVARGDEDVFSNLPSIDAEPRLRNEDIPTYLRTTYKLTEPEAEEITRRYLLYEDYTHSKVDELGRTIEGLYREYDEAKEWETGINEAYAEIKVKEAEGQAILASLEDGPGMKTTQQFHTKGFGAAALSKIRRLLRIEKSGRRPFSVDDLVNNLK
jgi:hypothetical protein